MVYVICINFSGLLGCCLNLLLLIMLISHPIQQKTFQRLMMSLAVTNCVYLVCSGWIFPTQIIWPNILSQYYYVYSITYILPLVHTSLTGAIMITCGISLERYITVCHPFFKMNHRWPASLYLIPIGVFSLIFTLPKYYEFKVVDINFHSVGNESDTELDSNSNFTIYSLQPTKLRLEPIYVNLYIMWSTLIVQGIFPYVVLLAMNICIFRTMRIMQRDDCGSGIFTQQRTKEVGVSKISILIVLVFMVCNSLKWLPTIWELKQRGKKLDDYEWPDWIEKIRTLSNLLITLSGSFTPLVYIIRQRRHFSCAPRQANCHAAVQFELNSRLSQFNGQDRRFVNDCSPTPSTYLDIHLRTDISMNLSTVLKTSRSLNLHPNRTNGSERPTSSDHTNKGLYLELPELPGQRSVTNLSGSNSTENCLVSSDTSLTEFNDQIV